MHRFLSLSVFLSTTLPRQTAAVHADRARFIRFGTCQDEAAPPSMLLLLAAAAAFIAHRYCCLNGGSPKVLGTCFTADTRLLLLPARYTARSLPCARRSNFPPTFRDAPRDFVATENFPVCWTILINERSACDEDIYFGYEKYFQILS